MGIDLSEEITVDEANQKIPWLEDQLKTVISLVNNIDRIKLGIKWYFTK